MSRPMLKLVNINRQITNKKATHRMLAAVMFADIAGYTALMQQDEVRALLLRKRQRRILDETLERFGGKVRQYYGDGALCTFRSAVEAVRCAVELQRQFGREPRVPVRIGIHLGDILFDSQGIYGNAVNIASRIESLSEPETILVSGKVHDEIKNQKLLEAVPLGTFELKNVEQPVEILAISIPVRGAPGTPGLTSATSNLQSIETSTSADSYTIHPLN